ncbi:uncharacterized protein C7orf50 homolog [Topomyia yanbarensis]|uniref:uncharacterized protein C7orf50 homolog n=1 Tax=Topomyia yanbarensis TaxID=2498891 RepID=UPI00273B61BE|nr:uncharacterized protein C7orf50 homolog [Topomyia yanbarensis]
MSVVILQIELVIITSKIKVHLSFQENLYRYNNLEMGKHKEKVTIEKPTPEAIEKSTVSKKEKRKAIADITEETSTKKIKPEIIAAGTTIDQALLVNPALKLNKKAKRAKQREKHAKNQEAKHEKSKEREKQETKQYLQMWNDNRDKWKFQKLKQIYIQEHVFDETQLEGEVWPIALEYLSGTKGSGKEALSKRAEAVINEIDQQVKDTGDRSLLEVSKYQRARDLLQYLG